MLRTVRPGDLPVWTAPALAAVALVCDAAKREHSLTIVGSGLLDEPAHLAFAALGLLVLSGFVGLSARFWLAGLVMSVAIDLDHVPLYLGASWVAVGPNGRPFTHSLATAAVLLLGAWRLPRLRDVLLGATAGLLLHLVRDIVEGPPGVGLFWPLSSHEVTLGLATWLGLVAALTAAALALRLSGLGGRTDRDRSAEPSR